MIKYLAIFVVMLAMSGELIAATGRFEHSKRVYVHPKSDICPNCGHDTYIPGRYCTHCGFPIWSYSPHR